MRGRVERDVWRKTEEVVGNRDEDQKERCKEGPDNLRSSRSTSCVSSSRGTTVSLDVRYLSKRS